MTAVPALMAALVAAPAVAGDRDGTAAVVPATAPAASKAAVAAALGPYECRFSATDPAPGRRDVNRGFTCVWSWATFLHVDLRTHEELGAQQTKVYQWFITGIKSLTVTHGIAIEGISGEGSLKAGGIKITAPYPCPIAPPSGPGCSTAATGLAVNIPALALHGTYSTQWSETMVLGSSTVANRLLFHDAVGLIGQAPGATPAAPLIVGGTDEFRCDDTFNQSPGCVNPRYTPTVVFDAVRNPKVTQVAKHMLRAQAAGKAGAPGSDPLTRDTDPTEKKRRNREACGSFVPSPPDDISCDEYPFATSTQGGTGASIAAVTIESQSSQGGLLNAGYLASRILDHDDFYVLVTGVSQRSGSVAPYAALNNLFNNYGDNAGCADWSGADATNSIGLPGGQRAWFFSDSYLGSPADRPSLFYTSSLNNSIVIQDGSSMRTITGGNTCRERDLTIPFFDRYAKTVAPAPDAGGFYWTGDQQLVGSDVVKFYYHGKHSGDLWVNDYAAVARIPVSSLTSPAPLKVVPDPLTCAAGGPAALWGTMTLDRTATDGWNYVYGTGASYPQRLYLARTRTADLTDFSAWQFFAGQNTDGTADWTGCGGAQPLPIGNALGGSVNQINGTIWLIQKNWTGPQIAAYPSATAWGFTDRHINLYTPPESLVAPYYYLTYEPRIQAGLSTGGSDPSLILSYNVNGTAVDTGCQSVHAYDARSYRPRFLQVPQNWFDPFDAGSGTDAGLAAGKAAKVSASIGGVDDWFPHWGQPCPPVPGPSNFTATAKSDGSVDMSWTAAGTDVWTYLYQCDATVATCSDQSACSADAGGFTRQFDGLWLLDKAINLRPVGSGASNGHRFVWYVCTTGARNGNPIGTNGNGGPSPHLSATVTVPPPAAPANLRGARFGSTVTLIWDEVTFPSNAVFYTPYRWDVTAGQTAADAYPLVPVQGVTSTNVDLPDATHTYGFFLKASNFAGSSSASNTRQF